MSRPRILKGMPLPRVDGRDARWDDHRAARRRHVLDAALAVIEASPPGAEINVQQIADEAGLVRTVVYRYFEGRADLQRAVQGHIIAMMTASIYDGLNLDGSIEDIIDRSVGGFVGWVADHPKLYVSADREIGDGQESQIVVVLQEIADRITAIIVFAAEKLGPTLDADDRAALDVVVFGIIGQVRGTVGYWVRRAERKPEPRVLAALLHKSIWLQIDAQARAFGLELDPTVPLRQMLVVAES